MMLRFSVFRRAFRTLPLLLSAFPAAHEAAWAQVPRRPELVPGGVQPQPQPVLPESMTLRIEGERITAEIRNTPLQKVLAEIAARTGVIFEVSTELNPLVSISLFRVGLQ